MNFRGPLHASAEFVLCGLCVAAMIATARADETQFVASRLLFHPLLASQFEPRMGIEKALDENALTLNIGNAVDLLSWHVGADSSAALRGGADFFTWSHLQSGNDFRFPVEAIDYLFGVNASWVSGTESRARWEGRIRLAHISAHAVDGLYDNYTHSWVRREPFTYSREFVDVIVARAFALDAFHVRALAGATVLLHSIPAIFAAVAPHVGIELHGDGAARIVPFAAYDGTMQRIDAWRATNTLRAGVKFGPWNATGTEVFVSYEAGASFHGERYDLNGSHVLAGVNIVF